MNLAIFELEKPIHYYNFIHETPLWSNMNEIFYPQDTVDGKLNHLKDKKNSLQVQR